MVLPRTLDSVLLREASLITALLRRASLITALLRQGSLIMVLLRRDSLIMVLLRREIPDTDTVPIPTQTAAAMEALRMGIPAATVHRLIIRAMDFRGITITAVRTISLPSGHLPDFPLHPW